MEGLSWVNPWVFAVVVLLPAFYWAMRESLDSLVPQRRWIALVLRSLLFLLLVTALADPRLQMTSDKRALVVLVDHSRSVEDEALKAARGFFEDNADLLDEYDSVQWLAFAGNAQPTEGIMEDLSAAKREALEPESTDLGNALNYASALLSGGMNADALIFSDGQITLSKQASGMSAEASFADEKSPGDVLAELVAQSDVRVFSQLVEPPKRKEVLVQHIKAPKSVRKGEPFAVEASLRATDAGPAQVQVFRDGVQIESRAVDLQEGDNVLSFTDPLAEEALAELAFVVSAEGDSLADNNRMSALVTSSDASRALLVTDDPASANYLTWALSQQEIELEVRPPRGMPTRMADLRNFSLMIVDNVAATDMTYSQQELVQSYVRDFGGGFLMMGGDKAYGLGGYYRTPIETLLPVRCDFENQRDTPTLGIALVIDKSGSMKGEKIEMVKEAARQVVSLLKPQDFAGVVAFDNSALWVSPMQRMSDRYGVERMISTLQASGGTNISPALEVVDEALSSVPAKLKHVILLTDGQSTEGPFYELTSRLARNRITVSTVGVGASADVSLLQNIARWGKGRHYYTSEARELPQIFTQETMTAAEMAIRELPFTAVQIKPAPFIQSIDLASAPFLYGFVVTEPKPAADVWLTTETGEPLLATWRYGLGKTAAFSSDARNRWALEWLRWEGYGPFWAQLSRFLMRSDSLSQPVSSVDSSSGDQMALTVDAIDEEGRFLTNVQGRAIISREDGQQQEVPLTMIAPGRFEAQWPKGGAGHYFIDYALHNEKGEEVLSHSIVETLGYPKELQMLPADASVLEKLATASGGAFGDVVQPMRNDTRSTLEERELWPYLLIMSLVVFLGDVAARRLP